MTKEILMKMGLTEEQATKVLEAHGIAINGKYIPKERFDEVNTKVKQLETSVSERDKQLDDLKKSTGDVEALKTQIQTLQNDNKTKEEAYKVELSNLKKNNALELALTGAKVKNSKAIKALLDDEKIKLKDDGTLEGLSEQLEAIKKTDAYLFEETQTKEKTTVPKGFVPAPAAPEGTVTSPASLGDAVAAAFTTAFNKN
ncbi:phage scaffolding protein [Fusobacterium ulcerans]|uniref:phage scaffolding protein n=1 Tax=Fusobacterium ulcerans TaxID=861 RepID=UPI002E79D2A0|nr:phage scaffolding protein [Fusobacterium ulcerans]MEE0138245.1 phage scaffolding protein [Fusobacterium ulcerans]